nr:DnaJ domain protein [Ipomoea batatas]
MQKPADVVAMGQEIRNENERKGDGSDMETDGGNVVRKKQKMVAKSTKKMMGWSGMSSKKYSRDSGSTKSYLMKSRSCRLAVLGLVMTCAGFDIGSRGHECASSVGSASHANLGASRHIKTGFEKLCAILSHRENHFALAEEAYRLVVDAWLVLSVPAQRAMIGEELKINSKFRSGLETHNFFWTLCPYCYYMYEYLSYIWFSESVGTRNAEAVGCGGDGLRWKWHGLLESIFTAGPGLGAFSETGGDMETDGGNVVRKKQKMVAKSTKKMMGKGASGLEYRHYVTMSGLPLTLRLSSHSKGARMLTPEPKARLVRQELKEVLERLRINQKLSNEVEVMSACSPRKRVGDSQLLLDYVSLLQYCYYVYEYPIYGFQRVLEREMQKSSDVVAMGKFLCAGFVQIRVEGCGGNGMDSWIPFSPLGLGAFAETSGDMETDGGNVVRKK